MSEAIKNQYIFMESQMTILELEKILAFRSKCAKLALSLIIIMDCVHKGKILHNNISLSNILLHFPLDHVVESTLECAIGALQAIAIPSMYGFSTIAKMERNKRVRHWVAP
jgi:hypothetical protein